MPTGNSFSAQINLSCIHTHTHRNLTQAFPDIRGAVLRKSGKTVYMTEVKVIFDIFGQRNSFTSISCLRPPPNVKKINNAIKILTSEVRE